MKKYFMVFFMVLLANTLRAQIGFGTKVDFTSLNGMVYNPGTHDLHYDTAWVTDRTNDELSISEIANYNYMIEENHPGHIILSDATATYNCHGYTFGIVQGTNRYNISWRADLCNNAFEIITTTPQPGDIAVMRYNNGAFDSPHSGIVVNQDTLISKWGRFPLTKHHKDSVIFITAYEIGQAPASVQLHDLQGRLLRTQGNAFERIDMSQLPAGIYTLRVTMQDGLVFSDKVVKE